jgi:hypothetical protein
MQWRGAIIMPLVLLIERFLSFGGVAIPNWATFEW